MELLRLRRNAWAFLPVLFFSVLGFLVMGYHPGAEDDGVYLTAIKADLNTNLYPYNGEFFRFQMRTSVFDNCVAFFVRSSGIPIAWAELLLQSLTILLVIWACWSILCQLFEEATARWGGLAMVAAMFTLPVAGTALYILDQHLHARSPALALILFAISRILAGKRWQAVPLVLAAFLLHPLMAALGIGFCIVLSLLEPLQVRLRVMPAELVREGVTTSMMAIPFGWVLDPPSKAWLEATQRAHFFHLYQWEWYEWLGAIGPMILFWLVARMASKRGETNLARLARAILAYSIFMQLVALTILSPWAPAGLSTFEPMRYLHIVYVFLALIGGAYLGKYVLRTSFWRWALFLVLANGGMFVAQRELYAGSPHLEMPYTVPSKPWLQSFDWIRRNTPEDAYFALDPHYIEAPGEDFHSFRALAERSMLSDGIKDSSVVTKLPELGSKWHEQQQALAGWQSFQLQDFERLKTQFGVDWVLVSYPPPHGLDCRWHNGALSVCAIP